jgi:hypothetical protein
MKINKKVGLLALPLFAAGAIGVAAVSSTQNAHAASPAPSNVTSQVDTPETNDRADTSKPETTNDTDNVQAGPQDQSTAADPSQTDGETSD